MRASGFCATAAFCFNGIGTCQKRSRHLLWARTCFSLASLHLLFSTAEDSNISSEYLSQFIHITTAWKRFLCFRVTQACEQILRSHSCLYPWRPWGTCRQGTDRLLDTSSPRPPSHYVPPRRNQFYVTSARILLCTRPRFAPSLCVSS